MNPTRYRVVPHDVHAHLFEVSCTLDDPDPSGQRFRLPTWVPGSYLIREFARHFVSVRAHCAGREIAVRKLAKDCWQVDPCKGSLSFTAHIYSYDPSVRGAYLDATRGFFVGACLLVWPEGREHLPCELDIVAPSDEANANWRVATSMPRADAAPYAFGRYRAADYDELIDHPVEMGTFELVSFEAGGAKHDIAVTGRHRGDLARFARDLQRVCQTQIDLFEGAPDSRAPVDYYLFQLLLLADGYGGLEHRSSTSLVCGLNSLPGALAPDGEDGIDDDYRTLLGLASHEYFHTWNVKRIKPDRFVSYDLTQEAYTRQLWAFEGITSYYDDLALVRSGVITQKDYLELVGRSITTVLRTPGRALQSLADSSFDAWIKYYRQDENSPNAITSYYIKGSLVALLLDLTLRREGRTTLDAIMRALWQRYGQRGVGVPEDGLPATASELAGRDLHRFFDDYVDGTVELPLADALAGMGIDLELRRSRNDRDKGGKAAKGALPAVWLGIRIATGGELRIRNVLSGGPGERAGLAPGDVIVAIDGLRATAERIEHMCKTRHAGEHVSISAFRRDQLMNFDVTLVDAPADACWLQPAVSAGADAVGLRAAWLSGAA